MKFNQFIAQCLTLATLHGIVSPASWAQAQTQESNVSQIRELVSELKIAIFRGSISQMTQKSLELESIFKGSPDLDIGKLCNYYCHYQMASYRLFRATSYPFLLSKDSSGSKEFTEAASPDAMKREADAGIALIDRGLSYLYRQQAARPTLEDGSLDTSDTANARAFREFTRQAAMLNSLKVRLYMAAGDAWYQSISKAQLSHLDKQVSHTLGKSTENSKDEADYAATYYESANWTLIEASTDLPKDGPEFDAMRNDFAILARDLETRMNSVQKGFLFLNIDPESYTNITVEELQGYLSNLFDKVKESEAKLDVVVKEYSDKVTEQANTKLDNQRLIRGQSMDLSLNKLAEMEAQSTAMQAELNQEATKLSMALTEGTTRRALREVEFELQKKSLEFANQKKLIEERSQSELLAMRKDSEMDRRQELRWLIDQNLALLNLNLQIDSFEIQNLEYVRQTTSNNNEIGLIQERITQNSLDKSKLMKDIDGNLAEIKRLRKLQGTVFEDRKKVFGAQISALDSAIKDQNLLKADRDGVCQIRKEIAKTGADNLKKVLECIEGGSCDGEPSQYQSLIDLAKAKVESLTQEQTEAQSMINLVKKQLDDVKAAIDSYTGKKSDAENIVGGLKIGMQVAQAIPEVSVQVGIMAGVSTTVNPRGVAVATLETMEYAANMGLGVEEFKTNMMGQVAQFESSLLGEKSALRKLVDEKNIQDLAKAQAIAEIKGQKIKLEGDQSLSEVELKSIEAECKAEANQISRAITVLQAEKTKLEFERDSEISLNALHQDEIEVQQAAIAGANVGIQRYDSMIRELTLQQRKIEADNRDIQKLQGIVAKSKDSVVVTKADVEAKGQESLAITAIISELSSKQRQQSLAISESEAKGLEKLLGLDEAAVREQIVSFNAQLVGEARLADVNSKIAKTQSEFAQSILDERKSIITQASKNLQNEQDIQKQQARLFLASEQNLANAVAGVPEFIEVKRRSLESANFALNLLRSKVRAIKNASISPNKGTSENKPVFLRSSTDFTKVMTEFCDGKIASCVNGEGLFFDETLINVVGKVKTIPKNSRLLNTLAEKGRASFRITPRYLSEQQMLENGYTEISMGSETNSAFNSTLIGVRMTMECANKDESHKLLIRHQGIGSSFRQSDGATATIIPEVQGADSRFYVANLENLAGTQVDNWKSDVTSPVGISSPRVRDFESAIRSDKFEPIFLGLPLFASYELVQQDSQCLDGTKDLTIGLIYSKPVKQ